MKQQFVECKSPIKASRKCPWAYIIAKCDDGFMAFESEGDYRTWKGQKNELLQQAQTRFLNGLGKEDK